MRVFTDKWAIIIGVDKFKDPTWNFKYAVKDARDFRDYLSKDAHFSEDHIKFLVNAEASKSNILDALNWCSTVAKSSDLVVIYYRTRGTPRQQGKNFLATGNTNPIAIDHTSIEMQTFVGQILKTIHAQGIVLIVDADYSGNVFWSAFPHLPHGISVQCYQALSLICSTEDNQICWESLENKNSVFTGALLRLLKKCSKDVPIIRAAAATAEDVDAQVQKIRPFREQKVDTAGVAGADRRTVDIIVTDPPSGSAPSQIEAPTQP